MVSLGLHLVLTFLLEPHSYFYITGRHHICLYIFLSFSLLLATSSFLWLALPFSIFLYVLLLVCHDIDILSLLSVLSLVYICVLPL